MTGKGLAEAKSKLLITTQPPTAILITVTKIKPAPIGFTVAIITRSDAKTVKVFAPHLDLDQDFPTESRLVRAVMIDGNLELAMDINRQTAAMVQSSLRVVGVQGKIYKTKTAVVFGFVVIIGVEISTAAETEIKMPGVIAGIGLHNALLMTA
jgi:hypothetical protein